VTQLLHDSDWLCARGLMDYSLLIGVQNIQYDVDPVALLRHRRSLSHSQASNDVAHKDLVSSQLE
jgi:hypothetical protein